ncbi:hypothetical protein ACOSP7_004710 [Xanthoceras sorbifolium]|uniref:DUF7870 domain-containing protein n=1 Tax=Xanthoceras sorbifolium TaxID=99658 RepID=A0ABQ8IG25_9ROSI|nr:hypothetical protein JRO89_XS02G0149100 [Xanthoceras sorbifolium]
MELARGYRAKNQNKIRYMQNDLNHHTVLVIKLPDSKVLQIISRSLFLAMVILSLPYIGSIFKGTFMNSVNYDSNFGLTHSDSLDLLFQDLSNEGLIKTGDNALVVGSYDLEPVIASSRFLNENVISFTLESDLDRLGSIPDRTFDFALVSSSFDLKFIDHLLKIGGILAVQLNDENSNGFKKLSNYKIGYLRRYNSTIVAMRKTRFADKLVVSSTNRHLLQLSLEAKKVALKDLEDVLLEPPRKALAKSNKLSKKIKFLPYLLGDSIGSYPRRVFINVGLGTEKGSMMEWFYQNYPTGNQDFEMYNLEIVPEKSSRAHVDVSDWLKKNVKEEEYVVMKVETEMAEEMIERRTIGLVDEMFLECNNQWQDEGKKKEKKSKRAYWECLALYGRLRDEGVAVHQWWG